MKRILVSTFAALAVFAAQAATLSPIQLLSPAGSTSGQVIASTGASTAPSWTTLTAGGLGGLAAANNLSDLVSAATARTNLGLTSAATTTIGTSGATIPLLNTANTWALAQTFTVRPTFNGATPWDSTNLASPATTTGNLSQFAATTSAQLAAVLSDETGSGSAVFGTSPTINTPTINGITNGSTAGAGVVGQIVQNSTTGTAIASGTTVNATSIASLPAGAWNCWGQVLFVPSASNVVANVAVGIGTTSVTLPASPNVSYLGVTLATGASGTTSVNQMMVTFNTSTTSTIYLVANAASVTGGTGATVAGYLFCQRMSR